MSFRRRHSHNSKPEESSLDSSEETHHHHHHHHRQAQPLVRTRSSAHLLLGQLTGTCSSLLRRLSVKVRYLSLSLIPTSRSRQASPERNQRPQSVDPCNLDEQQLPQTRDRKPRRHTTTVLTMNNESTPVGSSFPSPQPLIPADKLSSSPESDSEATPTPSPCPFIPTVAAAEDSSSRSSSTYLRTDDYPTLKASSMGRRRRRHGHHNHHHHRKSQTEVSSPSADPLSGDHLHHQRLLAADQQQQELPLGSSSSSSFDLDLNLTTLATSTPSPPLSSLLADGITQALALDQDEDEDEEEAQRPTIPHESTTSSSHVKVNPYLDWYLTSSSSLDRQQPKQSSPPLLKPYNYLSQLDSSLNPDRRVERSGSLSRSNEPEVSGRKKTSEEEDEEERLPYPLLLDDWISPSPPPQDHHVAASGEGDEEDDPLAALQQSNWFEEYAYPAYSAATKSSGGATTKLLSPVTPTPNSGSSSAPRMMTEKAYPYVSSPAVPRHQSSKHHYDPYDMLYDTTSSSSSSFLSVPADVRPKQQTQQQRPSSGFFNPLGDNSERGVHPGPESLPSASGPESIRQSDHSSKYNTTTSIVGATVAASFSCFFF